MRNALRVKGFHSTDQQISNSPNTIKRSGDWNEGSQQKLAMGEIFRQGSHQNFIPSNFDSMPSQSCQPFFSESQSP